MQLVTRLLYGADVTKIAKTYTENQLNNIFCVFKTLKPLEFCVSIYMLS